MLFYRGSEIYAGRQAAYKAHFITRSGGREPALHAPSLLYNLEVDPSERFDISEGHVEVIASIEALFAQHRETLVPLPTQLEKQIKK